MRSKASWIFVASLIVVAFGANSVMARGPRRGPGDERPLPRGLTEKQQIVFKAQMEKVKQLQQKLKSELALAETRLFEALTAKTFKRTVLVDKIKKLRALEIETNEAFLAAIVDIASSEAFVERKGREILSRVMALRNEQGGPHGRGFPRGH